MCIRDRYYKKINKEHYSSDNDERSVMDNAIGVAVNSSGSSTPVTSGNSYMEMCIRDRV